MAKGMDSESILVLSRGRTGLKREFEFALKAQSEIGGTLGRTRSRKAENGAIGSPESRSNKRLKVYGRIKKGKDREAKGVEKDLVNLMSEGDGEVKVDACKSLKNEGLEKEEGGVEPLCKDEIEKGGTVKSLANIEELEVTPEKALKIGWEDTEKNQGKASSTVDLEVVNGETETEKENKFEKGLTDFEEDRSRIDANKDQNKEIKTENLMSGEKEKVEVDLGMKNKQLNANKEGSSDKLTIAISGGGADDTKTENVFEVKPLRRFTRSSLKQKEEPVKKPGGNVVEQDSDFKSGYDGNIKGVNTSFKHEMNSATNFARAAPTRLKDLLDSGMLEGINVKYIRHAKGTKGSSVDGLRGVIRGTGILCFCHDCKGDNVVLPTAYEVHAGSSNKHPAEHIHLENGKTLRDVMNVYKENSLTALEEALRSVIGPSMKYSNFCFNCRGSIAKAACRKTMVLCNSCLELKEPRFHRSKAVDASDKSPKPTVVTKSPYSATKSSSSQTKTQGRVTRKDLRMHKLVFEEHGLPEGTELAYFARGQKCLVGYKNGLGILCNCCNSLVSPSVFEAHAGYASRRKPFQHIYTSNGVSLHELSMSLSKDRKLSTGEIDDLCIICLDGGDLLCCDTCPRAFHKECVSLPKLPTGAQSCRYCQNTFQMEKCVEHNANAVAAGRVEGVDPIEQITKRCIRIVKTPETENHSVCVLCRGHNFSKLGFGPQTVILCDQCEKEYHVGCLRDHNIDDLKELPEGQWFCCVECTVIHSALQKLVVHGEEKLPDSSLIAVKKNHEEIDSESKTNLDIRWRVLSGKMASFDDNRVLLSKAVTIFHDRFDPISESGSAKGDLIPAMVYGRAVKGQDFGGMYCAILTVNQVVVSAGIFRIFGQEVAELPLVATSTEAQGQGYFQCLFSCIEKLLGFLKVRNLVLPAADEAESIWVKKFNFNKMPPDEVNKYRRDYQMMIFQGTSMLWKPVPGVVLKSSGES
ncbi:hypothetical protein SLA2020_315390 [Shorea laevis]